MSDALGLWTEEIVQGHRCDVYQPTWQNAAGWVLVYLHGVHLENLRDKGPFLRQFERYGLPVVAPWAGPTWWTDRVCPSFDPHVTAERYVRESVLDFIRQRWQSAPPRIGLFGSSMGGQGALRMAYKYPKLFPVVAALAPAIDFQIRYHEGDEIIRAMYSDAEAVRQDTATLYVHPLNWPRHQFFCCDPTDLRWIESTDRLHMKLSSLGIPHECDLTTQAGRHGFEYYNHMAARAITFLVAGLRDLQGSTAADATSHTAS